MKIQNLKKTIGYLNFRKLKKPTGLFISALFIISALSFVSSSLIQVEAATPILYTFGDTTVETQKTDQMPTGWISAIRFTAPENGALTKLTYYCWGASIGKTKCFVYDSASNGSPNQLIASSSEVDVNTVGMWRDYAVPQFAVVSGAKYWVAFMGNVILYTPIASGEVNQWSWTGAGALVYPKAPSSFVEGGFSNYKASIYITYTPTVASPTPTSTTLPTPTPTLTPRPTATPTSTATPVAPSGNTNLAVIPSFWASPWWGIGSHGGASYPVTWQGHTAIKFTRDPSYVSYVRSNGWMGLGEIDGMLPSTNSANFVSVKPGDHVVFKAWIWTGASTVGGGGGCYMGADVWNANGRICELRGSNGIPITDSNSPYRLLVSWGSGRWVQLVMDFYIRSSYLGDGEGDVSMAGGHGYVPSRIGPWFQLLNFKSYNEGASAYIYGTELYINPK